LICPDAEMVCLIYIGVARDWGLRTRWISSIIDSATRRAIDLYAWVRAFGVVADEFRNCVFAIGAIVRVVRIQASRVVGELAPVSRNRDTYIWKLAGVNV
jgi:hypothetical protein